VSADASAAPGQFAPQAADSGGVIHNIGYRRYDAVRLGRAQIIRALTWHSFRAAFGIGRGAKAKIFPVLLFALMCLPAVINAVGLALNPGSQPIVSYDGYVPHLRTVAMLIFVALEAPNLVSSDLRNHTLPLYFSRPIARIDYPVAKLVAFVLACLTMIEIPLLLLYLGIVSQEHGGRQIWEETLRLGPGLLYGAAWALLLASAYSRSAPSASRCSSLSSWLTRSSTSAARRSGQPRSPIRRRCPAWRASSARSRCSAVCCAGSRGHRPQERRFGSSSRRPSGTTAPSTGWCS
jgi:hypothetical protein